MTNIGHSQGRRGFTLVEIMIVVAIIGLLASLALPAFQQARLNSQATAIANDFRVFSAAFEQYVMSSGNYPPPDWAQGAYPVGMEDDWLPPGWVQASPVGGYYVFHDANDISPLVLLAQNNISNDVMVRVDEILDDGDLATGSVRGDGSSLDYTLE